MKSLAPSNEQDKDNQKKTGFEKEFFQGFFKDFSDYDLTFLMKSISEELGGRLVSNSKSTLNVNDLKSRPPFLSPIQKGRKMAKEEEDSIEFADDVDDINVLEKHDSDDDDDDDDVSKEEEVTFTVYRYNFGETEFKVKKSENLKPILTKYRDSNSISPFAIFCFLDTTIDFSNSDPLSCDDLGIVNADIIDCI